MGSDFSEMAPRAFGGSARVDHLGVIGRHRLLVIIVVAWAIGLAALWSFTRPTLYTAEAGILVKPAIASADSSSVEVNPETESQVMHSTKVAQGAAEALERLGVEPPPITKMLASLEVDVPENTEILQVLYSASTPLMAKQGAEAFAQAYLLFRTDEAVDELDEDVATFDTQLGSIDDRLIAIESRLADTSISEDERTQLVNERDDLNAQRAIIQNQRILAQSQQIDPGQVIAPPLVPRSPSSPNHVLDLAIGAIIGLGLGFGLAYLRDRGDSGFQSAAALERSLGGIPVLAVIPSFRDEPSPSRDPISLYRSNGPISEAYRTLRTAILGRASRARLVSLTITSARSGEGKSTTAAMLGIALASAGRRVVLICGDLRRPMAHRYLGVTDRPGLADVLAGRVDSVSDVLQPTSIPNLFVVPSGFAGAEADPAELLQSDRMLKVLEECGSADFVLIDSPAVLAVADALVLAPLADGVLFVAAARGTGQQMIEFAKIQLERMGSSIIGGALVGLRRPAGLDPSYYHRPESLPAVRPSGRDAARRRERQAGVDPAAIRQVPPSHRRQGAAEAPAGPGPGPDGGPVGTGRPYEPEPRPRPRPTRIEGNQRPAEPAPTPGGPGEETLPLPEPPRRRRASAPSELPSPPDGSGIFDRRSSREETPSSAAFGAYPAVAEPDVAAAPATSGNITPGPARHAEQGPTAPERETAPGQRRVAPPRRRRAPQAAAGEVEAPSVSTAPPATQPIRGKLKPRAAGDEPAPAAVQPEADTDDRETEPAEAADGGPRPVEQPRKAPIPLGPSTVPSEQQQPAANKPRKRKRKPASKRRAPRPPETTESAPAGDVDRRPTPASAPSTESSDESVVVPEGDAVEALSDTESEQ
jgi:polysaccharide biosynthesis transport protein